MSAAAAHSTPALHSVSARSASAGVDPFDDALDVAVARDHAAVAAGIGGAERQQRQRRIAGGAALQQAAQRVGPDQRVVGVQHRHLAVAEMRRRDQRGVRGAAALLLHDADMRRGLAAAPRPCPGRSRRRCGRTPARSLPAGGAAWSGRRSCAASWAAPTSCACRSRRPGSRRLRCIAVPCLLLALLWRWRLRRVKACRLSCWFNSRFGVQHRDPHPAARSRRHAGAFGAGPCRGAEPADGGARAGGVHACRDGGDGGRRRGEAGRARLRRARAGGGRGARWPSSRPTTARMRRCETRPYPGRCRGAAGAGGRGLAAGGLHQQAGGARRARCWRALGLAPLFAAIGGGDSFPVRKPDPAHLLATLQAAGGEPAHAVMVGDHANDVAAARGAGVPCIFAAWGYGPPAMAEGAAAVADDFAGLVRDRSAAGGVEFASPAAEGAWAPAGRRRLICHISIALSHDLDVNQWSPSNSWRRRFRLPRCLIGGTEPY